MNQRKFLFASFALVFLLVLAPAVSAQNRGSSVRAEVATRSGVTRSCESRLDAIKTRMNQLTRHSENMFKVFDSIATRVQTFYTDKVLPTGKTLDNYDELVADIQTKKDAATSALNEAQADVNAFSCVGDVRSLYNDFRLDMQAVKTALKEYRTAVRNLIVAVHTLSAEESDTD